MGRILLAVNPSPSPGRTLPWKGKMKVTYFILAASLAITINGKPTPDAEPKAFFGAGLGAIALPAITNNAFIDGLLLGKVAFLKAAILANLLLGSSDEGASDDAEYGAPVDSYGAPAQEYPSLPPATTPLLQPTKSLLLPTMHLPRLTTHQLQHTKSPRPTPTEHPQPIPCPVTERPTTTGSR